MRRIRRLSRLSEAERALLLEAGGWVLLIRLGLWFVPFDRLRSFLARRSVARSSVEARMARAEPHDLHEATRRVAWAVRTMARVVPGATCLTQALAATTLLERRNLPGDLRIGVARKASGALEAHAWVESHGRVILGHLHDLDRFTRLPDLRADDGG